jgi:prepilin-type N-terminal cleavage/methylation domain-containing protein
MDDYRPGGPGSTGFTLIEMLVVLLLMGLMLGGVAPFVSSRLATAPHLEVRDVAAFLLRARNAAALTGVPVEVLWDSRSGVMRSSAGDSLAVSSRLHLDDSRPLPEQRFGSEDDGWLRIEFDPAGRVLGGPFAVGPAGAAGAWQIGLDPWTGAIHAFD